MKNRLAPRGVITPGPGVVLRPVIGVDIDGTLGYWHEEFIEFAGKYLQRTFFPYDGRQAMHGHLGVSKAVYRRVKLAFRQSGLKRAMTPTTGAVRFVREVRRAGAEVWVCTTRPYLRLDNIDPDTRWWLRHHGLTYDGVLFGERKYADLAKMVGPDRVLGVLDDLPEQVQAAWRAGLAGYLLTRPYNRHLTVFEAQRLPSLAAAQGLFLDKISHYLKEHHARAQ